ncbi:MAG: DUF2520 domain-containing protein [Acidobacteria bacterium]|nr:DUF2520 domain-containing protein [Acidobacteriota bacterium]
MPRLTPQLAEGTVHPAADPTETGAIGASFDQLDAEKKRTERLGFVGVGAVGQTLAAACRQAGYSVSMAHARAAHDDVVVDRVAVWPSAQACVDASDIVFLTVPDEAIATVCARLSWRSDVVAVHCSGATELRALDAAREAGADVAGFHPLQMFANPEVALAGLAGCTVGIEASGDSRRTLDDLAAAIGLVPLHVPAGARARYHASAYYVGPFAIALWQEAAAIWRSFGATEQEALAALTPLLRGTLAAAQDRGLAGGMGGCVARGDVATVRTHLAALAPLGPDVEDLYRQLARRTLPLALARGSLTTDKAAVIRAVLDDDAARAVGPHDDGPVGSDGSVRR